MKLNGTMSSGLASAAGPHSRWRTGLMRLDVRNVQGFHPHGIENSQCKPKIERAPDDALRKRLLRVFSET